LYYGEEFKLKEDNTMKFEMAKTGNLLIVKVSGELDHHFADEIRIRIDSELIKPPIRDILFDFNNLSFMDSSGIGLVMGRYRNLVKSGAELHITGTSQQIFKMFKLAGIEKLAKLEGR
jgi:stage II sporulation protein AA (anti-sigma F factor antagonist)